MNMKLCSALRVTKLHVKNIEMKLLLSKSICRDGCPLLNGHNLVAGITAYKCSIKIIRNQYTNYHDKNFSKTQKPALVAYYIG